MPESNLVEVRFGADTSGLRAGTREATGHIDSLRGSLLEMKAEATQTGRAARFFANDIASLIPASDGAKNAIRDLLEIGLAGGAFGAAVGAVKLLVGVFHELSEEERKAKEELEKIGKGISDAFQKIRDSLTPTTETEAAWRDWLRKRKEDIGVLEKKINDLAEASRLLGILLPTSDLEEQKKKLLELIDTKRKERDATEAVEVATKNEEEFQKRSIATMLEDAAHFQREKLKTYQEGEQAALKALKEFDAAEKKEEEQARADRDKIREEENVTAGEIAAKDLERLQKEQDKLTKSWKHVGEEIGSLMSQTVTGIITGTQSIGDAFQKLADRLLSMAFDSIFKGIFGSFLGPLGGILGGGIASIFGLETGGTVISAAVGADLPRMGGPFPALLHKGETVITHATTDRLDAFLSRAESIGGGGGMGGGDIHVHIHDAIDGQSVKRVVNSDEFRNAVAGARRSGRLSF